MGKKINLIGQKFSRLTVIEETEKRDPSGCVIWKCQCDCGNITYCSSSSLRNGHKQSCGCLNKDQIANEGKKHLIDLAGQKFGLLTVIDRNFDKQDTNRIVFWNCICDCGNKCIVSGKSLKKYTTQSCGCLKSIGEQKIQELLQKNNIIFQKEKIFSDFKPYRYDFFVNNTYIIEYDGKQHFQNYSWGSKEYSLEESQKRDQLKNSYCFKNNIPIIRIPYTYYNKLSIEDLLLETSQFLLKDK